MMIFGVKIPFARKQKENTRGYLGKAVDSSGDIISKFEKEEINPSIETACRIADALGVPLDYLIKDGKYKNIDKDAVNRFKLLERLLKEVCSHLFATMDAFFAKHKLQSLLQP